MADGPFRDDLESAVARADALAEENRQLRADLEAAQRKKFMQEWSPSAKPMGALRTVVTLVLMVGVTALAAVLVFREADRKLDAKRAELDADTSRLIDSQRARESQLAGRARLRTCIAWAKQTTAKRDYGELERAPAVPTEGCIRTFLAAEGSEGVRDAGARLRAWVEAGRQIAGARLARARGFGSASPDAWSHVFGELEARLDAATVALAAIGDELDEADARAERAE